MESNKNNKTKLQKILSGIESGLIACLFIVSLICCGANIYNRLDNISPLFLGYSVMEVETGSMTAETITIDGVTYESGHPTGSKIILHTVDTKTLGVGDMICFYVNTDISSTFDIEKATLITENTDLELRTTVADFFGFQSDEIKESGRIGCSKVFHHIVKVYEDENGVRWYKTRGSSNNVEDSWTVKETLVLGAYEETKTGSVLASITDFIKSIWGLIIIVALILVIAISSYVKQIEKIKKENK